MKPKKGHVVMVKMDIDEFYLQEDDDEDDPEFMPYIIPRLNYLIVGGMSQYSLDLNAKFEDQQKIIKKAAARFFPEIEKAQILSNGVGLRPVRSTVRIEHEIINNSHVIHNYVTQFLY
jgi:D-amino-acid oxidase